MSKWTDFSIDERKAMVQGVVNVMHISEIAVEKDWWVTATLYALFRTSPAKYLLFKGGTSLSKGWNIINRFSEDIDLAISRDFFLNEKGWSCSNCASNTQIHKLREKGQDYLFGEFTDELRKQLSAMGLAVKVVPENEMVGENGTPIKVDHDKDPSAIFIQYESLYDTTPRKGLDSDKSPYVKPTIKVEVSVLSMDEPFETRRVSSLIGEIYKGEDTDIAQAIKTVSPARTFLEKAFLLCEEYQKRAPRTYRMSRHFYDLEKLSHTPYADMALTDIKLYRDIVRHRARFYHVGAVDYDKDLPSAITIVPEESLMADYERDYDNMRSSFIYGDALDFKDLMEFLKTLQEKFRKME